MDTRREIVSLLSDKIKSSAPHRALMARLFRACQDTSLDQFLTTDDLFHELARRLTASV